MGSITFNAQDVELPNLDWEEVREWLCGVAEGYGKHIGTVNYLFVSDEEILRVNREFIGHDYYTDHIGFDYSQGNILSGDTYISLETVRTNAILYKKEYSDELKRVIVHSILHLCGINDKTPEERQVMESAEDKALCVLRPIQNSSIS